MRLSTSYKQILAISVPIMFGSAAQNLIVLTDNIFLFHKSAQEFAAIGLIGVFYLIISSVGYAISRGGQIVIARRHGESDYEGIGQSFFALFFLELCLCIVLFIFLQFGSAWFFSLFIDNQNLLELCLSYIYPRSYGIFFSFLGVAMIGLYTGIADTTFILIDTFLLALVNLVLNYVLIYGKFGFPEMGIVGAAWASTIAEICAFIAFVLYMLWDKKNRKYSIFTMPKVDIPLMRNLVYISSPIVVQAIIGMGSWFVFFSLVENLGQRQLEVSNLVRNVYLILSIPCWGFAAGINTIVSNFIGQHKKNAVIPLIWKTTKINVLMTLAFAIPVIMIPQWVLYPLFGSEDMSLIYEAGNLFYILLIILFLFSIGAIFFNGLAGTGATMDGLKLQGFSSVIYLAYIYITIKVLNLSLEWAWSAEILYWIMMFAMSYFYLKTEKWKSLNV